MCPALDISKHITSSNSDIPRSRHNKVIENILREKKNNWLEGTGWWFHTCLEGNEDNVKLCCFQLRLY